MNDGFNPLSLGLALLLVVPLIPIFFLEWFFRGLFGAPI